MANDSQSRVARRKQKKQKKQKSKPIVKRIFLTLAVIALVAIISTGGLFTYYAATAPELNEEQLSVPASTKVYDKDGNLFAELGNQKRTKIDYNDLPQVLVDAVTATEDARFFSHIGIDPKRIGGAVLANISDGFGAEGASTITQQVVKGSFLSPEKTLERKVQEQWLAIKLDSQYSKQEIMEMYLNRIYYGNHSYGVAKAAENYFGKTDLSELTLPEAALLAGLPQRPSAYDPTSNPELAKERMNTVLMLMVDHGKITEKQAAEAREVSVESLLIEKPQAEQNSYEAFLQQVSDEAKEKYGVDIYNDGVEIYTTLNPFVQEQVEFLLSNSDDNPISYPDDEFQAGLTVLDTKNGAIQAIGGSRRNEEVKNGWNYAIDGQGRQPGSTFKPIVDYGPAIEYNQWSTYHQIEDAPYEKGDTKIRNWNRSHQGWVSMRTALEQSLNVPAVKTFEEIGRENAQKFTEGLGIDVAEEGFELTDAIGGASTNVTPMELAGAYSAFGNEGIYNEPYSVRKIEFSDGRTEEYEPDPAPAMREYTAYMITDMLKSVVQEGTGTGANIPGLPVAGKTGTTNKENEEGSPDAWFSGYTTNYTISIWTGYDDNRVIPDSGLNIAKDLFRHTMQDISQGIDTPDFTKPDSVVEVEVEKGTNPAKLPSEYTPDSNTVTELFVKGTEPTKTSERFDQVEGVSDLKATYEEESKAIKVTWQHSGDDSVSFQVRGGSGSLKDITTTSDKNVEITDAEPGNSYTVEVTAVSERNGSNKSNPVTATVLIPEEEKENEEPENPENGNEEGNNEENPEDEQNGNENENGNNGNNGEGNGNEEGNGQGNGNESNENNDGNEENEGNQEDEAQEEETQTEEESSEGNNGEEETNSDPSNDSENQN